jgi:hypothetical protein
MKKSANNKKPTAKRGPKEERLKLNGDWRDAIKQSFQVKRPAKGWPKVEV